MKVSKREILLLTALFIVICGFLYYKFLLSPMQAEIDALDMDIETLQTSLSDMKLKQGAVQMMKKQSEELYKAKDEKLGGVMKSIDQPDMLASISSRLESLSAESGFTFTRNYQELDNCRLYGVEVTFLTNYLSFKQVLTRLGQMPYLNRVTVGSLKKADTPSGAYDLEADITVEFLTLDGQADGTPYSFITGTYPNNDLFS